jgi:Bacterial TSP3 repeat
VLIGWWGVPFNFRALADGYYDGDGNWIEDYSSPVYSSDSDQDGLPDYDEVSFHGTDPYSSDTDGDGISDYDEINYYYTNPNVWGGAPTDSDGDGLPDTDEIDFYGTNPFGSDTDGDGTSDYDEITIFFTNSTVSDTSGSNPTQDSDGDGLSDSDESSYGTDPSSSDSDADGYSDYDEILIYFTNPTDSTSYSGSYSSPSYGSGDSDGDGLSDQDEAYYHYTNPELADTDGDGLTDYVEIFGVIVTTYVEYTSTYPMDDGYGNTTYYDYTYTESYSTTEYTNQLDADTDNDLLPDGYEYLRGLNPRVPNDGLEDADSDGLTRGQEYVLGTNHLTADTDGDGHTDRNEFLAGTNPLDPASPLPSEPAPGSGGSGSGGSGSGTGGSGSGEGGSGSQGSGESGTGGNGTNPDPDPDPNPPGATPPPSGGSSQDYGSLNLGDVDADGLPDAWEFRYFGGKQRYSGISRNTCSVRTPRGRIAMGMACVTMWNNRWVPIHSRGIRTVIATTTFGSMNMG